MTLREPVGLWHIFKFVVTDGFVVSPADVGCSKDLSEVFEGP